VDLTTAQKAVLKAWCEQNHPAAPLTVDGSAPIAAALNAPADPAAVVWRTAVSEDEIMLNGFDWTRVDNLSVGKARVWEWMTQFGAIDPSRPNIRAGIEAVWVGTAADLAVRAAVYSHCKRAATTLERLFATGTGTDAVPATMAADASGGVVEGPITAAEVYLVRAS
jgi:hypothetical protein